jgi:hypothetical protein
MRYNLIILSLFMIVSCGNTNSSIYEISTSSPAVKSNINRFSYDKYNLIDGKSNTSFQLRNSINGIGEWIELKLKNPQYISRIEITNGFQAIDSEFGDLYFLNSRLKSVNITLNNVHTFRYDLPDTKSKVSIPIGESDIQLIRITITDIYSGSKWKNDLAISEISIYSRSYLILIIIPFIIAILVAIFIFRSRIINVLNITIKRETNPHFNEEMYTKGKEFERFIGKILASQKSIFAIEHWANDIHTKHPDIHVESDSLPDFLVRHLSTGQKFFIECKYRSNILFNEKLKTDVVNWANFRIIKRYQSVSKKEGIPIYVVIGIKGTPEKPEHLFCLPLGKALYPDLMIDSLKKYSHIPVGKGFVFKDGTLN